MIKIFFLILKNVLNTYSNIIFKPNDVEIKYFDFINIDKEYIEKNIDNIIGSVIFSSDKYGFINKDYDYVKELQTYINNNTKNKFINVISGDLLHHIYLPSHKDLGAKYKYWQYSTDGITYF